MFSAVLDNIGLFRDSVATISELIDEGQFKIRKNGIELLASDRAVVAVVDFSFSAKNFKEYNYKSDINIGVNLSSLLHVLRRANANDVLQINVDENSLSLKFKNGSTRKFTLPLIEIREDVPSGIDKMVFKSEVELSSEILSNGIDDADLVSDSVIFEIEKDSVLLKSQGDSSSTELRLDKGDQVKINTEKNVKARYSIDYLKKMIKAKKLSDKVKLELDSNYPLKMTFSLPGKLTMSFILAPRVEE